MSTSHAIRETYGDKKSDSDEPPSCDGTVDFQSASPADYEHKVVNTVRTERGTYTLYTLAQFLLGFSVSK